MRFILSCKKEILRLMLAASFLCARSPWIFFTMLDK